MTTSKRKLVSKQIGTYLLIRVNKVDNDLGMNPANKHVFPIVVYPRDKSEAITREEMASLGTFTANNFANVTDKARRLTALFGDRYTYIVVRAGEVVYHG